MPVNTAVGPLGASLVQPPTPAANVPAAADPNLWQRFLAKMQADPNFSQALLTTGLTLLGDPQPGESGFGTFSRAALSGVQTLDALRARERQEGRRDEQLDIQRTAADASTTRAEASVRQADTSAARADEAVRQFDERMNLARDQLTESVRATNLRAAGTATGAERMMNSAVEALVMARPDVYPDTDEGRAKARLRASGLDSQVDDPLGQARVMTQIFGDLVDANTFLDEPLSSTELQRQTEELFNFFSTLQAEAPPQAGTTSELHGMAVPGMQGVTIVQLPGEDRFALNDGNTNSTRTFTEAEIRQRLGQ